MVSAARVKTVIVVHRIVVPALPPIHVQAQMTSFLEPRANTLNRRWCVLARLRQRKHRVAQELPQRPTPLQHPIRPVELLPRLIPLQHRIRAQEPQAKPPQEQLRILLAKLLRKREQELLRKRPHKPLRRPFYIQTLSVKARFLIEELYGYRQSLEMQTLNSV